jgi:hypothetical protein
VRAEATAPSCTKRKASRLVRVAAVLAWGASLAACRQIVGIGASPREELGDASPPAAPVDKRQCGGLAYASAGCGRCMETACCAEAVACADAPGCGDLQRCLSACAAGDAACAAACRTKSTSGFGAPAAALASCEESSCAAACATTCGGYVYPTAACGMCAATHCCAESTACMRDESCATLAACERACAGDAECLAGCELGRGDGGVAEERALGACLAGACPSCVSSAWACLAHQPTLAAAGPNIHMSYAFQDYTSGNGIQGLTVKACLRTDLTCASPIVPSGLTDAYGRVLFELPTNHFEGYVEVSSASYGPVLLFVPPLVGNFGITTALASKQTVLALEVPIATQSPERGLLIVTLRDCAGRPGTGVKLALAPSDGTTAFYFAGGLPTTATSTSTTDVTGGGGFANVPAGTGLTLSAVVAANGLAYANVFPFARPGNDGGYTAVVMEAAPP